MQRINYYDDIHYDIFQKYIETLSIEQLNDYFYLLLGVPGIGDRYILLKENMTGSDIHEIKMKNHINDDMKNILRELLK